MLSIREDIEDEDFYFQQDGAPLHFRSDVRSFLFLWGYLKDKVYATKPAKVAELREAIEHECAQIPRELFHDVCDSIG